MRSLAEQKGKPANLLPPGVPDEAEVQAWVHLVHAYHRISRRLEQALDEQGLTLAQFEVLARLHFEGAITQSELAQRLLVTKGNVCGLLDRMTAAGLVTRKTDPADRRANQLHMTPQGRKLFAATFPKHIALIKELMEPLSATQLRALCDDLPQLAADVELPPCPAHAKS